MAVCRATVRPLLRPVRRRSRTSRRRFVVPAFADQRQQVGLESRTVFGGMLEQEFNQPPFAGTEVPMNTAARQPVQERHRLLGEKFFEFVGGHAVLVNRDV